MIVSAHTHVPIALTYIHGIGNAKAREICEKVNIPFAKRVNELSDAEVIHIREAIDADYMVEGDLRRAGPGPAQACSKVLST